MKFFVPFAILSLSWFLPLQTATVDYYWKDYYGELPSDAFLGGTTPDSKPTYIAQVFVPERGVLLTRLYPGQKSVTAAGWGIFTTDVFIKVLCTNHPEKLSWFPTTASTFDRDTIGKHLVIGGTESSTSDWKKLLNVGRVPYNEELIVGKVCGYIPGNALMFFPYQNQEKNATSYQVLVYTHDA